MGKVPADELLEARVRRLAQIFRAKGRELQVYVKTPMETFTWVDVPPIPLREQLVKDMHVSLGHVGRDKLLEALRDWYWWPGMYNSVLRCLSTCLACCKDAAHPDTQVPISQSWKG